MRLAKQGDLRARDQLIIQNTGFIQREARVAVRRCRTHGIPDLVSIGQIALLRAIDKYEESHGTKFLTYAAWWIRQAIGRAAAEDVSQLSGGVHKRELISTGRFSRDRAKLGDSGLTDQEIDRALMEKYGCREDTVKALHVLQTDSVSLDATVGEGRSTLHEMIAPTGAITAETMLATAEHRRAVRAAVGALCAGLAERERAILVSRLMPSGDPLTLSEVAERFQLSRERVRQIEAKLITKLQTALASLRAADAPGDAETPRAPRRDDPQKTRAPKRACEGGEDPRARGKPCPRPGRYATAAGLILCVHHWRRTGESGTERRPPSLTDEIGAAMTVIAAGMVAGRAIGARLRGR